MTESETGGPELYFPALGGVYEKLTPYTWPLVRVTVGLMLVPHGWMKLIGGGLEGTARFMAQIGLEPGLGKRADKRIEDVRDGACDPVALGQWSRN